MISESYRQLNRKLHEERPDYGANGHRFAAPIKELANQFKTREILDYGCGKQSLGKALDAFNVLGYDPCIEGLDKPPEPADIVYCGDVLEHVEPEYLDSVLDDLKRVTKKAGIFVVHTYPAEKTLSDGRNAHLIQEYVEWWIPKIRERFFIQTVMVHPKEFIVVVNSKES